MLYTSVLDIHAFGMTAAFLLFLTGELLLFATGLGAANVARLALGAVRVGNLAVIAGLLAGITLVYLGGWPLTAPWLLLSFALIAALMAVNRRFVEPWQQRFQRATTPAERRAIAAEGNARAARLAVVALFAAIGAVMILKPALLG